MKEKGKSLLIIIISLIIIIFSGKMIYNRINLYLYGDTIEISDVKKPVLNEISKNTVQTDTQTQKQEVKNDTQTAQGNTQEQKLDASNVKSQKITIKYQNKKAKKVKISASFYKWKDKDMKKVNGEWIDDVFIKDPGEYKYYFVVDGKRVLDSNAKKTKDGKYSILEVK